MPKVFVRPTVPKLKHNLPYIDVKQKSSQKKRKAPFENLESFQREALVLFLCALLTGRNTPSHSRRSN